MEVLHPKGGPIVFGNSEATLHNKLCVVYILELNPKL